MSSGPAGLLTAGDTRPRAGSQSTPHEAELSHPSCGPTGSEQMTALSHLVLGCVLHRNR